MNYEEIIKQASSKLNMEESFVDKVYKNYWASIRQLIINLPLKESLTEGDFEKIKTNFNIPSLGKLNCTYDQYNRIKNRYNQAIKFKKDLENET